MCVCVFGEIINLIIVLAFVSYAQTYDPAETRTANIINTFEMQLACDLNFTVNGEGLLKVTGSHVYWKSAHNLEPVLDTDVVTTCL